MSSFRFELDETPQQGLRRIAASQAAKAQSHLEQTSSRDVAVHESRKALKRLKTLFKLVRQGLKKSDYEREYTVIRDAGRALSGARDLDVMPVSLTILQANSDAISADASRRIHDGIATARKQHDCEACPAERVGEVIAAIAAARARYKKLELTDNSFDILAAGSANALQKLRRQHKIARTTDIDEKYHDWRKSAQLHWRQLRLLSECWPEMIAARMTVAKGLADVLGLDHDLAVLAAFIEAMPDASLKPSQRKSVLVALRKRQLALREEARIYAGFLVVDEPDNFAERLRSGFLSRQALAALPDQIAEVMRPEPTP